MAAKKPFLSAVSKEVAYHFVIHAIAVAIAGISFHALVHLVSEQWRPLVPYTVHLTAVAVLIALYVAIRQFRVRIRNLPSFERLECDFHVLSKELSISFHAPENIRYSKKITLKALRNGLDRFCDKYNWTGRGKVEIRSAHEEHTLQIGERASVWTLYELKFGRTLNKGETIDIEVIWNIEDKDKTATPFLSTTIHEPTDHLMFKLHFADCFGVKQIICEESPDMGAVRPYSSEIKLVNSGQVEWQPPHPKLLHYYQVRWTPHYKL